MRVALVRHPAVDVAAGVCYGRLDVALSDAGRAALPGIAADLAGFALERVWTSPARRCVAVAEWLGCACRRDARLLELDFGDWEGLPWDAVPRDLLDSWAAAPDAFAAPGGERVTDLVARVRSLHGDLRREGRDCVVITHGGVLKVLGRLLRDRPVDLSVPAPAMGSVEILTCSPV